MELRVEKITSSARLPEKANPSDLGYDLFASEDRVLLSREVCLVPTGLRMEFPAGYGAKLFDRSSVSTKEKLFIVAGVIDNGYRGEVKVAMWNPSLEGKTIKAGTKICQMVLIQNTEATVIETPVSLDTDRGEGGFGSSGK